jgi:hypothetical protein
MGVSGYLILILAVVIIPMLSFLIMIKFVAHFRRIDIDLKKLGLTPFMHWLTFFTKGLKKKD